MLRISLRVKLSIAMLGMFAVPIWITEGVGAAPQPSFRVTCLATNFAKDDPIVYPGRPGASHQHTFYGNRGTDAHTTIDSLLAAGPSSCERGFDAPDKSAYWIPSLYKNGREIRGAEGRMEMSAYYRRAGGAAGGKIDQSFPQGLRIIAGSPSAAIPQEYISYRCQDIANPGSQDKWSRGFPNCSAAQSLMAEVTFPDCWDGKRLDSPDHKTHMAYSSGSSHTCPATHPVKVPQLTLEAIFKGVNGSASDFALASGGQYTLHADFFAAWEPRAQAALVNQCINGGSDCTSRSFSEIDHSSVTTAQINQQIALRGQAQATEPTEDHTDHTGYATDDNSSISRPEDDYSSHDQSVAGVSTLDEHTDKSGDAIPATGRMAAFSTVAAITGLGLAYAGYKRSQWSIRQVISSRLWTRLGR